MHAEKERDVAGIAAGLTKARRDRIISFGQEPRQMGIGMPQWLPGLVESDGFDHPLFGPHYRLSLLGQQVRQYLQEQSNVGR